MSWEARRGDDIVSKDTNRTVTFLADSALDSRCFIGEDEDGNIFDDYLKDRFIPYIEMNN